MMKRIMFFGTVFCTLNVSAQPYIITFAGTGASTAVNAVKVENLMTGAASNLTGSDILGLTQITGVNSIEDNQLSKMRIYPNPMTDNSTIEVFPPVAGETIITIHEMTGKPVAQIQSYLENSPQVFRLSGLDIGVYLINVKGKAFQFSGKLLSNGKSNGAVIIEKVDNNIQAVDEKKISMKSKGTMSSVDMQYSPGDRLKFTGVSGIYSTVMTVIPASDQTITFNFIPCTDGDNINYPVVAIGTQVWMAENLKTTKFRDGTVINLAANDTWGIIQPAYCNYNNLPANGEIYGRLYNFYAVGNDHNLCPAGWHVPVIEEWTTLITYLGGDNAANGKLRETGTTHWEEAYTEKATNETGFTALPGGAMGSDANSYQIGSSAWWWSSTSQSGTIAWYYYMESAGGGNNYTWFPHGFSVRCVKDI